MTVATPLLERLLARESLGEADSAGLMRLLADDTLPPAVAGALLAALRSKGETADELRGFARAMRELALPFGLPPGTGAADCVGTGGDASGSFNLSTGSALVAAACGVPIVKHGNRSVSSKSGSADVLEALGIRLPPDVEGARRMFAATGFVFLFAPHFHPAMKAVAPVRRAMGVRTVFNILGPLTNPAAPPFGVIGAYSLDMAKLMADALAGLPIERYFVVHGDPGWDEATPCGPYTLFDVRPGVVRRARRDPADAGIAPCAAADLAGSDAAGNAAALEAVLLGRDQGPHREALLLGAGLLLEVTGRARGLARGVQKARSALESGAGNLLLARLREWGAMADREAVS